MQYLEVPAPSQLVNPKKLRFAFYLALHVFDRKRGNILLWFLSYLCEGFLLQFVSISRRYREIGNRLGGTAVPLTCF
jgi:hypothetical protein